MFVFLVVLTFALAGVYGEVNVAEEMGYFSECRGKKLEFPADWVTLGASSLGACQVEFGLTVPSRECMATCVADKLKLIKPDRTYDVDEGRSNLVKAGIEKEIVDIQMGVLTRCSAGKTFPADGVCAQAKEFAECMNEGQKKDCAKPA